MVALIGLYCSDKHHLGPSPTPLASWSRSPISAQAWESICGLASLLRTSESGAAPRVWEGMANLEAWVIIAQTAPLLGKG